MMKKMVCCLMVVFALFLVACEAQEDGPPPLVIFESAETAQVNAGTMQPLVIEENRLDVLIMNAGIMRRRFEPQSGIYIGAYIESDMAVNGVAAFEELTGVEHAIFANSMIAGEEFPFRWILELAAVRRTPLLTIQPYDRHDPFDMERITKTAQNAGFFNLPIFVNLFPVSRVMGYEAQEYVAFFREAREIFARYAPNAAIVWSVHFEDVFARAENFYPGEEYVDWAGVAAFSNINNDGEHIDVMRHIGYFYFLFQREHPIMITALGVSYFTTANFSFHTQQAADEIVRVYNALAAGFPRIKAVVYASFDATDFDTGRNLNNYRITGEPPLIEAYGRVLANSRFLNVVDENGEGRDDVTIKSPFQIAEVNGVLFLPIESLIQDFRFLNTTLLEGAHKMIGGNKYVSLQILQHRVGIEFFVNHSANMVLAFVQ